MRGHKGREWKGVSAIDQANMRRIVSRTLLLRPSHASLAIVKGADRGAMTLHDALCSLGSEIKVPKNERQKLTEVKLCIHHNKRGAQE